MLPDWVVRINKKDGNNIAKAYFYLMKELHLSYDDISNMPVPAIFELMEQLGEYAKDQEKQAKKAGRKR